MKEQDLFESEWDTLILLDACRYDYFKNVYEEYLSGKLQKRKSIASRTGPWLRRNFGEGNHNEIVYVSSTPQINSTGTEVTHGFDPSVFHKVVDVWDWGWKDELNTVLPKTTAKATRNARAKYPGKRIISHFNQPHIPYISLGPLSESNPPGIERARRSRGRERPFLKGIRHRIGEMLASVFGRRFVAELGRFLDIRHPTVSGAERIARKYGNDKLHEAYEDNLRRALESVSSLVTALPGSIIVTADHGELLGDDGTYGHPGWSEHPKLREVPWLEVD